MEYTGGGLSPQQNDVKEQFISISENLSQLIASLNQEDIDILNDLRHLSKRFSDSGKMASAYYLSCLLAPYTNKFNEIFEAVRKLSSKRQGALIVIQREDPLDEWITPGVPIHAEFSGSLLDSIFPVGSPLHDGAVLIHYDIIVSAANILPLTKKTYKKKLGTRHRAAIGLSERTDALIVVVSEETGRESFSYKGALYPFQLPESK